MSKYNNPNCTCDYSYTCPSCQAMIDIENQKEYNEEVKDWMQQCVVKIAEALKIELPEPPRRRY